MVYYTEDNYKPSKASNYFKILSKVNKPINLHSYIISSVKYMISFEEYTDL